MARTSHPITVKAVHVYGHAHVNIDVNVLADVDVNGFSRTKVRFTRRD